MTCFNFSGASSGLCLSLILFYLFLTLPIGTVVNVLSVTTEGRLSQTSTVLQTTDLDTVIRVRIGIYRRYWLSM